MAASAPLVLSLWQKRQATLLYHFASLDYLKSLKPRIDALINGTDLCIWTWSCSPCQNFRTSAEAVAMAD